MKNDVLEYFYADISRFKYILYAMLVAVFVLFCLDNSFNGYIYKFIRVGVILITISALIFLNYGTMYNEESKLKVIKILMSIISLLLFIKFIDIYDFSYFGDLFNKGNSQVLDSDYFLMIVFSFDYLLTAYYDKLTSKDIIRIACIVTLAVFFVRCGYTFKIFSERSAILLFSIINILPLVISIKRIVGVPFKKGKEINIFFLLLVLSFTTFIIEIILILKNGSFNNGLFIVTSLSKLVGLLIFIFCFCEKIINKTYTNIFDETIKINSELSKTNLDLKNKTIELEKTRQALQDEEILYKQFLKLVPIPLLIINIENKRISYCNRSFINLVNNDIRDIINNVVDNLIKIEYDDLSDLRLGINKIYRGKFENGSIIKDLNIMPLALKHTEKSIILVVEDVTEKRKVEKIKKAILDKEINEKIKKDFLSNISHDLKTPINVISSAAQLNNVYAESRKKDSIKDYLNVSKQNLQTLIQLTDNLIKFEGESKIHISPAMEESNVVDFLDDKISSLIKYAESKGIILSFCSDENEILLKFDKEFLERIILNLISNAMKFTASGGSIKVHLYQNDSNVIIKVSDSGRGMSKEFIETAFDKYSMKYDLNDSSKDGSGIGLFVVYNLMRLQGGNVEVKSEEGKGTQFTLTFKRR